MRNRIAILSVALGAGGLGCFSTPDTLGNPCVQDTDCFSDQTCLNEVCVAAEADGSSDAAGSDTSSESGEESTGGAAQVAVRVIHASPDLGAVDVYAEGSVEPLALNLDYADASEWLNLDLNGDAGAAETFRFELRTAGSPASEDPLFTSADVELSEGEQVSAIAAGLAAGDADDGLRVLAVREDWGTDLADRARVRVVHAGADAPELEVDGLDGPVFSVSRFDLGDADGVPVDVAGGERLQILDAGASLTAFTAPPLTEGDQILLVATGLLGSLAREGDGFSLLAIGQDGSLGRIRQDPQLFTLHGARDAGNLENCTNGFEVAANFNYGEVQSAFLSPGEYDFEIFDYPSGCTAPALNMGGSASGPLDAGERYLLLLTGERVPDPGEPSIQVVTFLERFSLDAPALASLRFVHGASAEQIYVGNVTGSQILEADIYTDPIGWRSESVEAQLPQATYLLGVADAVGLPPPPLTPLVTFDYTATPGARAWGIVSGDPTPETGDGVIQLMLLDTTTPGWDVTLVDINP